VIKLHYQGFVFFQDLTWSLNPRNSLINYFPWWDPTCSWDSHPLHWINGPCVFLPPPSYLNPSTPASKRKLGTPRSELLLCVPWIYGYINMYMYISIWRPYGDPVKGYLQRMHLTARRRTWVILEMIIVSLSSSSSSATRVCYVRRANSSYQMRDWLPSKQERQEQK